MSYNVKRICWEIDGNSECRVGCLNGVDSKTDSGKKIEEAGMTGSEVFTSWLIALWRNLMLCLLLLIKTENEAACASLIVWFKQQPHGDDEFQVYIFPYMFSLHVFCSLLSDVVVDSRHCINSWDMERQCAVFNILYH